ncbi:hypothetical protein ABEX00_02635 [Bacillus safensis]
MKNEDQLEKIHEALNHISRIKKENDHGVLSLKDQGKEVTVFSDSIVISMPVSNSGSGFQLLNEVIFIQMELMYMGIFIRGGMTAGMLYHSENIVFGPAMNEAYCLETKYAIYPRVIVSSNYLQTAYQNGNHPPEEERRYFERDLHLIKKDEDDYAYVDFLNQEINTDGTDEYIDLLERTKKSIMFALNQYNEPKIREKYNWIKEYFNKTCEITGYGNFKI